MQALSRDVPMPGLEQQPRQRNPLAGRTQTGLAKASGEIEAGTGHCDTHM